MSLAIINDDQSRIEATKRYLNLNLNRDSKLNDIAMLASQITYTPVCFITLTDKEIQWMTTCHGYEVAQMPMETSFCKHTIRQEGVFIVPDTFEDKSFAHYPIVNADPAARFYAGAPLRSHDGYNVGTLCVMDVKPNKLNNEQIVALQALSRQVAVIMELDLTTSMLRKSLQEEEDKIAAIEKQNRQLKKIAWIQSHEFRGPLCSVMSVMNLIKDEDYTASKDDLRLMESAVNALDKKICHIVEIASS